MLARVVVPYSPVLTDELKTKASKQTNRKGKVLATSREGLLDHKLVVLQCEAAHYGVLLCHASRCSTSSTASTFPLIPKQKQTAHGITTNSIYECFILAPRSSRKVEPFLGHVSHHSSQKLRGSNEEVSGRRMAWSPLLPTRMRSRGLVFRDESTR